MAYRVDIEHDFDRRPSSDPFGSRAIQFILGDDTVSETIYFMVVRLVTDGSGLYDIRFGIEEREVEKPDWVVGMDYTLEGQ